jgi:hypothetical protein
LFYPEIEEVVVLVNNKKLKFFPQNKRLFELLMLLKFDESVFKIDCFKNLKSKNKIYRDYICAKYAKNYENTFHLTTDITSFKYFEIDSLCKHNPFAFIKKYSFRKNDFSKLIDNYFDSKIYLDEISFTEENIDSSELIQFIYYFDEKIYAKQINILAKHLLLLDTVGNSFDLFTNASRLIVYPLTESSKVTKCSQDLENVKFLNLKDLSVCNCSYSLLNSIVKSTNELKCLKVSNIYEVKQEEVDERNTNLNPYHKKLNKLVKIELNFNYLERYNLMLEYLELVNFEKKIELGIHFNSNESEAYFSISGLDSQKFINNAESISLNINANIADLDNFDNFKLTRLNDVLTNLKLKPYNEFENCHLMSLFKFTYPRLQSLVLKTCNNFDIDELANKISTNTNLLKSATENKIKVSFINLNDYISFYTKLISFIKDSTVLRISIKSPDKLTEVKGLEQLVMSDKLIFDRFILRGIIYNKNFKRENFKSSKLIVNAKVSKEENIQFLSLLSFFCNKIKTCEILELNNLEENNHSIYSILNSLSVLTKVNCVSLNNVFLDETSMKILLRLFANNKITSLCLNNLILDANKINQQNFYAGLIRRNILFKFKVMNFLDWRILAEEIFTTENTVKLLTLYSIQNIPMIILANKKKFTKLSLKNLKVSKNLFQDILAISATSLQSITLDLDYNVLNILQLHKLAELKKIKIQHFKYRYENSEIFNFLKENNANIKNIQICELQVELRNENKTALNKIYKNIKF